ncbi:MAG: (2Fe-2S) ferredoxin domain-containing protein [Betaproteobacteria bacterium]|nr:(2Fe-2S) ferredoxin domain-containing protein [Betaproteobacteria bacterium]
MTGYKRHVFVCLNERDPADPRGSCKHRGAEGIFKVLKEGAGKAGLEGDVRINRAGCLDHCEYGPTVVVYPEAAWYHVPTVDDANEILRTHVVGGKIVERLLMDNMG